MKKTLIILLLLISISARPQGNFFGTYRYQLPKLFTMEPYSVGTTTAGGGGILMESNGCPQSSIGICCSSVRTPEWGDNVKYATFISPYYATFTGLTPNTFYLYRTWIYTGFEFVYGDVKYFTTSSSAPTTYHNESTNYTFYRSNCVETYGQGYFPNAYTYNVAHGVCNELTQTLADACAAAIAAANGQNAANASGTCSQANTYANLERDSTVTHTGCGYGCEGTQVTYHVYANTYVNQSTQAAANALELSDLAGQVATNQGSCHRPSGVTLATFYYRGSGVTWTTCEQVYNAAGGGGFTCMDNQCSSRTGYFISLSEGNYVYSTGINVCQLIPDGYYVVDINGNLEAWRVLNGLLTACYV